MTNGIHHLAGTLAVHWPIQLEYWHWGYGVAFLVCVAVENKHSLRNRGELPPLRHNWTPEMVEKLLRICVFGGGFVGGLRGQGQDLYWITDDDAIVATDEAKAREMA